MAMSHNSHDDRVLEALTSRSVPAEDHLLACASCRAERAQLETSLSVFSAAAREATDQPGHFWTRQAAQIHSTIAAAPQRRLTFGSRMTSALALLAIFAFLLVRAAPAPKTSVSQAAPNSDHELLLAVERPSARYTGCAGTSHSVGGRHDSHFPRRHTQFRVTQFLQGAISPCQLDVVPSHSSFSRLPPCTRKVRRLPPNLRTPLVVIVYLFSAQ